MRLVVHVPTVLHPGIADAMLQATRVIKHPDANRCEQLVYMSGLCAGDGKRFGDYLGSCSFCWGAFGFLPASQGVANEPAQVQPAALVVRLCVESIPDQLILLLQDMAR